MAQINLYFFTQAETKTSLLAEQITHDMDNHLLNNLKDKIEGRTTEEGIILKVIKLIDYGYGIIDKVNFMGTAVFHVKYECLICSQLKMLK